LLDPTLEIFRWYPTGKKSPGRKTRIDKITVVFVLLLFSMSEYYKKLAFVRTEDGLKVKNHFCSTFCQYFQRVVFSSEEGDRGEEGREMEKSKSKNFNSES